MLILCHQNTRAQAKQVEKFVHVALELRKLNNYSALQAFVAGINSALEDNKNDMMDIFKAKCPESTESFKSWDELFQRTRSHNAYRTALTNTNGPRIPAL